MTGAATMKKHPLAEAFLQYTAQQLTRFTAGQFFKKIHRHGNLEPTEMRATMGDKGLSQCSISRNIPQHHQGAWAFAQFSIWNPNHSGFQHCRVHAEHSLDLRRIDIDAT
jgi:hypothetical protein